MADYIKKINTKDGPKQIDYKSLANLPTIDEQQSDWNINDENSTAYIQNRPFYTTDPVEKVLVEETTVEIGDELYAQISSDLVFTVGQTYKVTFNGTEYECVAWGDGDYHHGVYVGNGSICGGNDSDGEPGGNGEPFSCDSYGYNGICYLNASETGTYTIKISAMQLEVIQLDEKYISYKPGLKVEGKTFNIDGQDVVAQEGAEIFNGYDGNNIATGSYSHAEGVYVIASGDCSHAEGGATTASGMYSHAEGGSTIASGTWSHAECRDTTASGESSHAEGYYTVASGIRSHAEGWRTIAAGDYQHTQGKYNIEDTANKYAHIVGNGSSNTSRSNAHTLDWEGNAWYAGDVYVGGTSQDDAKKLATLEDLATAKYKGLILIDHITGCEYILRIENGTLVTFCKTDSIAITTMPNKVDYVEGEVFDPTGMIISVTSQNGSSRELEANEYTYESVIPVGATSITITYTEGDEDFTVIVPLNVTPI